MHACMHACNSCPWPIRVMPSPMSSDCMLAARCHCHGPSASGNTPTHDAHTSSLEGCSNLTLSRPSYLPKVAQVDSTRCTTSRRSILPLRRAKAHPAVRKSPPPKQPCSTLHPVQTLRWGCRPVGRLCNGQQLLDAGLRVPLLYDCLAHKDCPTPSLQWQQQVQCHHQTNSSNAGYGTCFLQALCQGCRSACMRH